MLDYERIFQVFDIQRKGVLHVGAHFGEEMKTYSAMGFGRVLFVEADPGVFYHLKNNLSAFPGVALANVAITDRDQTVRFNRASNLLSSSILPLKQHAVAYPDVTYAQTIEVHGTTIDNIITRNNLTGQFNFLNIDIQGAELMALKGAVLSLNDFDAISAEVNLSEMYEGCPLIEDVDAFLKAFGFIRVDAIFPHKGWGDAFYVKRTFAA